MSVLEGELLAGKYRVERMVGRGGMGVVFAATHTQLDQRVALKFLVPEGETTEDARIRFLREARAAVRLRSEHVARVLDVGTVEDGAPYIVMEYLEGEDLADVLARRGRLSADEAVGYVLQAAEAVAEAHALGIIHRDLKPANLFLTRRPDGSPCVKVLDFGIAKSLGSASFGAGLTQAKAIVGTPHYMSPEQIRSSKNVDMRSDIWAMGMILYELVTGVVAFPRDTLPELCSAIILDPIPPLRMAAPDLPEDLERAITQALAKAPENRPQSLAELADALAPFAPDGAASAARIARILKLDGEAPPSPPPSSQRLVAVPAPPAEAPPGPPVLVLEPSSVDRVRAEAPTERPPGAPPPSSSGASGASGATSEAKVLPRPVLPPVARVLALAVVAVGALAYWHARSGAVASPVPTASAERAERSPAIVAPVVSVDEALGPTPSPSPSPSPSSSSSSPSPAPLRPGPGAAPANVRPKIRAPEADDFGPRQ